MTVSITEKQLKNLVKESVKEALSAELMTLRASLVPLISPQEQKEVEKLYAKPSRKIAKTLTLEVS